MPAHPLQLARGKARALHLEAARGDIAEDVLDQGRRHHLTATKPERPGQRQDIQYVFTFNATGWLLVFRAAWIEGDLLRKRPRLELPQLAAEDAASLWIPLLELRRGEGVHNGGQLGLLRPGDNPLERLFTRVIRLVANHADAFEHDSVRE